MTGTASSGEDAILQVNATLKLITTLLTSEKFTENLKFTKSTFNSTPAQLSYDAVLEVL